ncbi:MAG: polysaccharide export protein [Verrucomicrobiales bacterium]|nr:polysaccharide export protein [Verrucomicrobiales bacterium]
MKPLLPSASLPLVAGLLLCAAATPPPVWAQDNAGVRIASGDTVDIRVFRHDDIGGKFTVGSDGTVILQFVGSVSLSGMTPEQATQKVTAMLADGWLRKPQVSVNIAEFGKNFITVKGAVNRGGGFTVTRNKPFTVSQAIGMAGGFNNRANRKAVMLQRGQKSYTINVKEIESDPSLDIPLKDGDVLTVRESAL